MARPQLKRAADTAGGAYFTAPKTEIQFVSTGCKLLDCVLGGGYPLGRIVNLVGDKSTGKTLLAIEACANFARQYKGKIWYNEIEAAFDKGYAGALGLPLDRVEFVEGCFTVEDLFEHMEQILTTHSDEPGVYIVDSLDALSDRAELGRKIDEGTYGGNKPKQMGQLFRRLNQHIEKAKILVIVISQVRDAIGVTFGEKNTRSGGRALDFYASQALWLAQIKTLKKMINKVERPIGVDIRAKCKKNKVGLPLRSCDFPIKFGFGIDDITANIAWLEEIDKLDLIDAKPGKTGFLIKRLEALPEKEYQEFRAEIATIVEAEWYKIEREFIPTRRKY
jgi:recombination protein RecA